MNIQVNLPGGDLRIFRDVTYAVAKDSGVLYITEEKYPQDRVAVYSPSGWLCVEKEK